jgi:hypothetical protein
MPRFQETYAAALLADTAVAALIGDRLYPGQVPDEEDPPPWLYYAVPESTPFEELAAVVDIRSEVEVHAMGETYAQAVAILDRAVTVLQGMKSAGVRVSLWSGTTEETTDDGYHHVARFTVWWRVTA